MFFLLKDLIEGTYNYKTCAVILVQKINFVVKWQQYYPNKPM